MNPAAINTKIGTDVLHDIGSLLTIAQYNALGGYIYRYITDTNAPHGNPGSADALLGYLKLLVLISDATNTKIQRRVVKLWQENRA